MKYKSECQYIKSGVTIMMKTPVDGMIHLLHEKRGSINIMISVKRRESLYMYLNQIITGVEAKSEYFKKYMKDVYDIGRYIHNLLEDLCVDKTEVQRSAGKLSNSIKSYHEIVITYDDLTTPKTVLSNS